MHVHGYIYVLIISFFLTSLHAVRLMKSENTTIEPVLDVKSKNWMYNIMKLMGELEQLQGVSNDRTKKYNEDIKLLQENSDLIFNHVLETIRVIIGNINNEKGQIVKDKTEIAKDKKEIAKAKKEMPKTKKKSPKTKKKSPKKI